MLEKIIAAACNNQHVHIDDEFDDGDDDDDVDENDCDDDVDENVGDDDVDENDGDDDVDENDGDDDVDENLDDDVNMDDGENFDSDGTSYVSHDSGNLVGEGNSHEDSSALKIVAFVPPPATSKTKQPVYSRSTDYHYRMDDNSADRAFTTLIVRLLPNYIYIFISRLVA
jgi:hypothetical protein